jgi:SAM-dependent MidA family methyltransferase
MAHPAPTVSPREADRPVRRRLGEGESREIPLLEEIIRCEIQAHGPITFARFMELALYHPQHGYYASGRACIGRAGDFFTNVSVGSIFGKLLSAQFAEVWEQLGRPRQFTIVEQGAHDGQFAADVLTALAASDCFASLTYVIVEPFPVWRKRQEQTLASFGEKVSSMEGIDQLEPFTGIHFSNELNDALPVHLVSSEGGHWKELFVTLPDEEFRLEQHNLSAGDLELTLRARPPLNSFAQEEAGASALGEGEGVNHCCSTEVSLTAPKLLWEIAAKLLRGVILTIDYGFTRDEFYSPPRSTGTLQVRAQHKKLSSPFEQIGMADVSAHVEWTSLIKAAESAGTQLLGLTDQHHFLTGLLSRLPEGEEFSTADKRALQTLLHPEMLGRSFQALALRKNFGGKLSGFRFSRDLS